MGLPARLRHSRGLSPPVQLTKTTHASTQALTEGLFASSQVLINEAVREAVEGEDSATEVQATATVVYHHQTKEIQEETARAGT